MTSSNPPGKRIAIVVPADSLKTAKPVLNCVSRLADRDIVEFVLVLPDSEKVAETELPAALDVTIARVPSIYPLSRSRAEGIRAATAECVFIGETHSFPREGLFKSLLDAHDRGATVVVPMFENENPIGLVSWAGMLNGYAAWAWPRPEGPIGYAPLFNASYLRSFLLGAGANLESALLTGEDMMGRVKRSEGFAAFAPDARIGHVNIARLEDWLPQRLVAGRVIASVRSSRWSRTRRVAFSIAAPLIPLVLLARHGQSIRKSIDHSGTSALVLPLIGLGLMFQAAGEFLGYAFGPSERANRAYDEYEVEQMSFG